MTKRNSETEQTTDRSMADASRSTTADTMGQRVVAFAEPARVDGGHRSSQS